MRIIDCQQATAEWWMARRGIPSASNFDKIITPVTCKMSSQADDYIAELIGDIHRQSPPSQEELASYTSRAIKHGVDTEPEARNWLSLEIDSDIEQVGLCVSEDGRFCASPDGLIREKRVGVELKCPQPKQQVKYLLSGELPAEYRPQVMGGLIVTGYESWLFCSYCPGLPSLVVRVKPDAFTQALRVCLEQFWKSFSAAKAKIEALRENH